MKFDDKLGFFVKNDYFIPHYPFEEMTSSAANAEYFDLRARILPFLILAHPGNQKNEGKVL